MDLASRGKPRVSPRRANPELTERRREVLVKAGYAEILEKGLPGLTIEGVVERARSSKGGALYYFPKKDDLVQAVLEWLLAELDRTLGDIAGSGAPPGDLLRSEIEVLFHSAEINRKLYRVLFDYVALASRAERYRRSISRFLEACRRRDAAIIEKGTRAGEFRTVDPEAAASTLRALVDGYCLQWLMGPEDVPLEVYRDRCQGAVGRLLRRP